MPVKKKTELEQLINDIHHNHINYHTREIYLHSSMNGCDDSIEAGVEYRMAVSFIKNLHVLSAQSVDQSIIVHMHSIGGMWNDGMAMINAMRFVPTPITFIAYAQASSMTGIILQGADLRVATPDCEFLIHHGSIEISNNSIAAKSAIDVNERQCNRMLEIFARRAKNGLFFKERGYNESRIKSFMDRKLRDKSDWCLTAEEAVYYGFADGILGEKGYASLEDLKLYEKYKGKI